MTTTTDKKRYTVTIEKIEKFLQKYMDLPESGYSLALALWTVATFIYPDFDAFPYMVITSDTKRSGKTRLAELLSFVCSNPVNSGALSPAAIYKTMGEEHPTLFFDEAETLNSEAANTQRSILNMGYRKGSVVRRVIGNQVKEYEVYCPKVFILIGDVFDTLSDRAIIVRMRRGEPKTRFVFEQAKLEGAAIREEIAEMIADNRSALINAFMEYKGIGFLTDRDEEIWTPLFVVANVLLSAERMKELNRTAVDMSTEKTQDRKAFRELLKESEAKATQLEYSERLMKDMVIVINGDKAITSADAISKLWELETSPWRKFRGDGLTVNNMADMLSVHGVRPTTVRIGKKVAKGYKLADVRAGVSRLGK